MHTFKYIFLEAMSTSQSFTALVVQMEGVLLSCNCPCDTAQGHLKEESQLRDCSDRLASRDVCGKIPTAN